MKKELLIHWSDREFLEFLDPILLELSTKWNIHIVLNNISSSENLISNLKKKCSDNIIKSYYLGPKKERLTNTSFFRLLNYHKEIHKIANKLLKLNISYYLTSNTVDTFEKYIISKLSKKVKIILIGRDIKFFFEKREKKVRDILYKNYQISFDINKFPKQDYDKIHKNYLELKNISKIKTYIYKKIISNNKKKLMIFFDRYIFPYYFINQILTINKFENDSQTGDNFDFLIVFDKYEELVFKKIFFEKKIFLAQYPTYGTCVCDKYKHNKKIILSPLSVFGDMKEIPEYYSRVFLREILISLKELHANEIHFRHHPEFKSRWIYKIIETLQQKNIKTKLISSKFPIRETICKYRAFIGLTSNSLKDARASCNNCIVIGFEAPSQYRFKNPRFIFGKSDGINWIDANGKYNKKIFNQKKYINAAINSVPNILNQIDNINDTNKNMIRVKDT